MATTFERKRYRFEIDENFDRIGVWYGFDVPSVMGRPQFPDNMKPMFVGTPREVDQHMLNVVQFTAQERERLGLNSIHAVAINIDDVWFTDGTMLMLYEIARVPYDKKPLVLEGEYLVPQDS